MNPDTERLLEAATRPYISSGKYAWYFARGKLRHDPFFFWVLRSGLLPERGRLLDLGCGQGLLLALLSAARRQYARGEWPRGWPAPSSNFQMQGIELDRGRAETACRALGPGVEIDCCDIRRAPFPACSLVVMNGVLLYLDEAEQIRVLQKAVDALRPGGLLLLREADAGAGLRFHITQWTDRLIAANRGRFWRKLHYRAAPGWISALEKLGLAVHVQPMRQGTPFSNILLTGRRGALSSAEKPVNDTEGNRAWPSSTAVFPP
jgi:SAM-dependent methyltransferase